MNYQEAKKMYETAQNMQPKDQYKLFAKMAHQIKLSAAPTLEEIDFMSNVFKQLIKVKGFPGQLLKKLNLLNIERLKILGIDPDTVSILFKKNHVITLKTATIGIGDPTFFREDITESEKKLVELGHRIFFSTGSDGEFSLQVRVVDAPEPILSLKEYKRVSAMSETFKLSAPSGRIALTDFLSSPEMLFFDIFPGNYKVCIYVFSLPRDGYSYYICFAKTDETAVNIVANDVIPVLEPN